jgi:hypothetical protein
MANSPIVFNNAIGFGITVYLKVELLLKPITEGMFFSQSSSATVDAAPLRLTILVVSMV